MFRFFCRFAGLIPALFPLRDCKPASPPPAVAGVSIGLKYPVRPIGQKTFDGRDSEAALVNAPGSSGLNLIESVVLDSGRRLFEVVTARAEAGSKPVFPDLGKSPRKHEVILRQLRKPSFERIRKLVLAEIHAPHSYWSNEPGYVEKAEAKIRPLHTVGESITGGGEYWN